MLVLTRKAGEQVQIGETIAVRVLSVQGKRVRLGFSGPRHVPIRREEVYRQIRPEIDRSVTRP